MYFQYSLNSLWHHRFTWSKQHIQHGLNAAWFSLNVQGKLPVEIIWVRYSLGGDTKISNVKFNTFILNCIFPCHIMDRLLYSTTKYENNIITLWEHKMDLKKTVFLLSYLLPWFSVCFLLEYYNYNFYHLNMRFTLDTCLSFSICALQTNHNFQEENCRTIHIFFQWECFTEQVVKSCLVLTQT